MAKKSKRNSGPRPGSNRAERVAARKARQAAAVTGPVRPFAGVAAECDLVALRAFVASATAQIRVRGAGAGTNTVSVATVLPGAVPALTRDENGQTTGLVGLQTEIEPDDIAGSVAAALLWASSAQAGEPYAPPGPDSATALDLAATLGADTTLDVIPHDDFSWWFADEQELAPDIAQMVEQATETILPTARIVGDFGGAPWWVDAGERAHVRWVRSEPEDDVMSALARLHSAGGLTLGEGSRFAGSFRTHGLLVPVFDLDNEMHPDEWIARCVTFDRDLVAAIGRSDDLTAAERRSRDGIRARQVTIR